MEFPGVFESKFDWKWIRQMILERMANRKMTVAYEQTSKTVHFLLNSTLTFPTLPASIHQPNLSLFPSIYLPLHFSPFPTLLTNPKNCSN
jgi:hypothetical protein